MKYRDVKLGTCFRVGDARYRRLRPDVYEVWHAYSRVSVVRRIRHRTVLYDLPVQSVECPREKPIIGLGIPHLTAKEAREELVRADEKLERGDHVDPRILKELHRAARKRR